MNWLQHITRKIRDDLVSNIVLWLLVAVVLSPIVILLGWNWDDIPRIVRDAVPTAIGAAKVWLSEEVKLSRAWVLLLSAGTVLASLLALLALLRTRRSTNSPPPATMSQQPQASPEDKPAPFEPIPVVDEKYGLEWHVVVDPKLWLYGTKYYGDEADIIDGPFHAEPSCNARLETKFTSYSSYAVFDGRCPRCGRLLFTGNLPTVRTACEDVVEELRRLRRVDQPLTRRTTLEHAGYWKGIRPPAKAAR